MKLTTGEKIYSVTVYFLIFLIAAVCIYPIIYVISASFSSPDMVAAGKVVVLPKNFTIKAYESMLEEKDIWTGYANAIFYTVVGTFVSIMLTIFGAYPLSRKKLVGKKLWLGMVTIALFFNAGIVPNYLNYIELGLLDTRTSIIMSGACASMYVIIMKTFFESLPSALEEAATIDGANQWQVLFKIVLPLSKASITTVGLMYAVSRWNGYFWAMVLLKDEALQPLQVVLKRIIVDVTFQASVGGEEMTDYSLQMITYSVIVISMAPMLIIYPFVQKYFEKGMTIGAVKG